MNNRKKSLNIDNEVVDHFGREWAKYNYLNGIASEALDRQFMAYTRPINLAEFEPESSVAADFGAGSGRWAERLVPFFHKIYALDPGAAAVQVMNEKFSKNSKVQILHEDVERNSISENSLDLAISLGVLHHIPDTHQAILDISKKIKSGGMFLCYLYYKVEDKPFYYRTIFRIVNVVRYAISRMPHAMRMTIARLIAFSIYLPLARYSRFNLKRGKNVANIPLHHYANMPFVMLENDALDRFGTRLEHRFNKSDIRKMLEAASFDLTTLQFSDAEPFWTFSVRKI